MEVGPVVASWTEWPGPVDVVDVGCRLVADAAAWVVGGVRLACAFPSLVVATLSCAGSVLVLVFALGEAVCFASALPVWCGLGAAFVVADAGCSWHRHS